MSNKANLLKGNELGQGFKPGQITNPLGRAAEKVVKEFLECKDLERLKILAEEAYKSAIGEDAEEVTEQELPDGKIIRTTKRWREKSIRAFEALLNRGYGQPRAEVEMNHTGLGEAFAALQAKRQAQKKTNE